MRMLTGQRDGRTDGRTSDRYITLSARCSQHNDAEKEGQQAKTTVGGVAEHKPVSGRK